MSVDSFSVVSAELTTHASATDRLADRADQASSAIRHVRLDRAAYGQLCSFIPTLLDALQERIESAAIESSGALHGTADRLRQTAAAYDGSDTGAAIGLSEAGRGRQ